MVARRALDPEIQVRSLAPQFNEGASYGAHRGDVTRKPELNPALLDVADNNTPKRAGEGTA